MDNYFDQFEEFEPIQVTEEDLNIQPLQASATKRNFNPLRPVARWVGDVGKGLMQGVSSLGIGLGKNVINPLRSKLGKEPLSNTRLDEIYSFLDDEPTSTTQKVSRFVGETMPYMLLPEAAPLRGAGAVTKLGNAAITGGYQGAVVGGVESIKNKGVSQDLGGDITAGAALGGILNPTITSAPYIQKGIRNTIENPAFQKNTAKTLEVLTSVPSKYSQRALNAELAGNSLFKGKFDADTAYIPIEKRLREAKNLLPTGEDFAMSYKKLGDKASQGMKSIKDKAGQEIQTALQSLNNKNINNTSVQEAVNNVIDSYGVGGVYNSARRNAPRVTNLLDEELGKEGLTLRDLHRLKEDLYDIGYQSAGARQGKQAEVARGTADQINNYLRDVSPNYAVPNDRYSLVTNIERGLDNENTIANKIRNIGSEQNILNGLDDRLKAIDNLLPSENKFYKQAQDIIQSEAEIHNIRNAIGRQYERNPRLLSNRNDEAFVQAVEDLQKRTGTNFMDELNDIRAREALENWFPGQGGGSGSKEGFGNLLRTAVIGGAPTAAAITRNPSALAGLLSVSPKFAAQGTIKNLGKLYNSTMLPIKEKTLRLLQRPLPAGSYNLFNPDNYPSYNNYFEQFEDFEE